MTSVGREHHQLSHSHEKKNIPKHYLNLCFKPRWFFFFLKISAQKQILKCASQDSIWCLFLFNAPFTQSRFILPLDQQGYLYHQQRGCHSPNGQFLFPDWPIYSSCPGSLHCISLHCSMLLLEKDLTEGHKSYKATDYYMGGFVLQETGGSKQNFQKKKKLKN